MGKYEPLPPPGGADALLSLLSLLQNPEAVRARLAELTALHAKVNAGLALRGTAEEIRSLHDGAALDRAKAADALKQAKAQAEEITRAATVSRDAALAEAGRARTEAWEIRQKIEKDHADAAREDRLRQQAFAEASRRTEVAWAAAKADRDAAQALKAEWEEKIGKLKAAGVA